MGQGGRATIDRRKLVERHRVEVDGILAESPLSVGNGELCFTVDVTGLQSLPGAYPLPERSGAASGGRTGAATGTLLGTQSQWGWHTIPWHAIPAGDGPAPEPATVGYPTSRGVVPYVDLHGELDPAPGAGGLDPAPRAGGLDPSSDASRLAGQHWLRANPHRLDLGRLGFCQFEHPHAASSARPLAPEEIVSAHQHLDLWSGKIESRFRLAGQPVQVALVCHPSRDALALRVRSPLLGEGRLGLQMAFAYGSPSWNDAADWDHPFAHTTVVSEAPAGWQVARQLDATRYAVELRTPGGLGVEVVRPHVLVMAARSSEIELVVEFRPLGPPSSAPSRVDPAPSRFAEVEQAAARHWQEFWSSGAAVELAGSEDPRAAELERRVVLSQYLTAINGAGSMPPQETGLMVNSWYGRFHLEMHWWHAAHFALWNRPELLERSMGWYVERLGVARRVARAQGYAGARWPKQVGPDGRESPSPIGPFLIWQQPHPIHLAELVRRARPSREVLERYGEVVFETAEFMADFAEATEDGYALGPPLVPAQECYWEDRRRVTNPTFELAYWRWAMEVAGRWRARLGLGVPPRWRAVADQLAKPLVRDGRYAAIAVPPYTLRRDHPSMLLALGFLPPTPLVDPAVMSATLDDVLGDWDWGSAWGWDFPAMAMTATRLGRPLDAVAALTMDVEKNRYLANGHNRQSATLPVYLPGNGGLLAAVALMAGGFDGAPGAGGEPAPGAATRSGSGPPTGSGSATGSPTGAGRAPGFPPGPGWVVVQEGFCPVP